MSLHLRCSPIWTALCAIGACLPLAGCERQSGDKPAIQPADAFFLFGPPPSAGTRTVSQISSVDQGLVVLCTDGTVWILVFDWNSDHYVWKQIPTP
jgi:hypothetical protein